MIVTKTKRKIIVKTVVVEYMTKYFPIEIQLPANVKEVTGILVTNAKP